jgi:Domain of unknown function (DUF4249)
MKRLIYLLIIAEILLSCNAELEEEISWGLDEYPDILVVEGMLTNEIKYQSIFLSLTSDYFNTDLPIKVSGAEVSVREGGHVHNFFESTYDKGVYLSEYPFSAKPLQTYELMIDLSEPVNGTDTYSAISTMPEGIILDTIFCEIYNMPEFDIPGDDEDETDSTLLGIRYFGKEPENAENYYLARVYRNKVLLHSNVREIIRFTDDYSNGGTSDFILFPQNMVKGDTVRFRIYSIEKKYYEFLGGIQQIDQAGNAYNLSGPPANPVGNVSHALGFFTTAFISDKQGMAVDMR